MLGLRVHTLGRIDTHARVVKPRRPVDDKFAVGCADSKVNPSIPTRIEILEFASLRSVLDADGKWRTKSVSLPGLANAFRCEDYSGYTVLCNTPRFFGNR